MRNFIILGILAVFILGCGNDGKREEVLTLCGENEVSCLGVCKQVKVDRKNCGGCGHMCKVHEECADGVCRECGEGTAFCEEGCVDILSNAAHCGGCGKICVGDQQCIGGVCGCVGEGLSACGGDCVDTRNDKFHCGGCGLSCLEGQDCRDSRCVCSKGELCRGECVDYQSDARHCGECGEACGEGAICVEGQCKCEEGRVECGGKCVLIESDVEHCGGCDKKCGEGMSCENKVCICKDGLEVCDGKCVDKQNDVLYCGDCETKCAEGGICRNGKCSCSDGFEVCDGKCVDVRSDRLHCGECGKKCEEGQVCSRSACVKDCGEGLENCGGECFDLHKTTRHCGRCYHKCKLSEHVAEMMCVEGECKVAHCDSYAKLCDDGCKDIRSDVNNCGNCGVKCQSHEKCIVGKCEWSEVVWGSDKDDEAYDIAVDSEGNMYVTGYTEGTLDGNLTKLKKDAFLTKIRATGITEWTKQWGTSGDDIGLSVVIGEDGFVYVGGSTTGSFQSIVTTAKTSMFIAKYSKSGEKQFVKQYGTMEEDQLVEIFAASGSGIYVSGHSQGIISGLLVSGEEDIFAMKLDGNGREIWKGQWGSSKSDTVHSMFVKSGFIYLIGTTHGDMHDGILPGSYQSPNAFILKAEDKGNVVVKQWIKEYGSLQADAGRLIFVQHEKVLVGEVGKEKVEKDMDVIYIMGETSFVKGGHFDGHPTYEKGRGAFLAQFSEDGKRLSSKAYGILDKYFSLSAWSHGYLRGDQKVRMFSVIGQELKSEKAEEGQSFSWQLLENGQYLKSSVYVGGSESIVRGVSSLQGRFYVVGGTKGMSGQKYGGRDFFVIRRDFSL